MAVDDLTGLIHNRSVACDLKRSPATPGKAYALCKVDGQDNAMISRGNGGPASSRRDSRSNHLARKLWRGNVVSSRVVRPLCVVLAATTLNGCGWFDGWFGGKPSPLQSAPLRPGVDRQTTATGLPPAPNRGTYDAGVAPVDDNRNQPLGAIVTTKGGQKAQLEAAEKERAQREAEREKDRVQREAERARETKEGRERPQGAPPAAPPSDPAPAPAPASAPPPGPAPSNPPAER